MALYQPVKQGSVRGTPSTSSSALMHPLTTPCAVGEKGPGQCIYLMSLVWFVKINGFYCCTVLPVLEPLVGSQLSHPMSLVFCEGVWQLAGRERSPGGSGGNCQPGLAFHSKTRKGS